MKKYLVLLTVFLIIICGCGESKPSPQAPQEPKAPQAPASSESSQSQDLLLELTEPQDESLLHTSPVNVSGVTSPDAQVSINGQLVDVDEQGNFAAMVEMEEGPNTIEITATDSEGNEESRILSLIYIP